MRYSMRMVLATGVTAVFLAPPLSSSLFFRNEIANAAVVSCHFSALIPKLGRSRSVSGTTYYSLEIVNKTATSCTLRGTPIARPGFLAYSRTPWVTVGPPARSISFIGRGGKVVIEPGRIASVEFGVTATASYLFNRCVPRTVSGVQIHFTTIHPVLVLDYVLPKQLVCTAVASTSIMGIVIGP